MDIRKAKDILPQAYEDCHGGTGALICKSILDGFDSRDFQLFHYDDMPAGVSIGVHEHLYSEEAYFLLSGKGILTFDGREYEMKAGDFSLCTRGHSHGFLAEDNSVLIVVASKWKKE